MTDRGQWTPGAGQAHTWLDPWDAETVTELLREADQAGWTSYIIDSDHSGKTLSGHNERITRATVTPGAAEQLLEDLHQRVQARHHHNSTVPGAPILLILGESAHPGPDPRLLTLARLGRAANIHLAVDRDATEALTRALGTGFRDNILGNRRSATLTPTGNDIA
ncbi:hypothetical protein [Nocardia brasiliensis]|uniref:hypothetical protein n=1 Tax=Nocardia brasiliensis TaxID=37326 RepID=UPI0024563B59|nr:hypothetical protein [Nocardia brasiliensis]